MSSPEDDRLSALLADLPRPAAPPGFTGRLLERVERRRARQRRLRTWTWALGAAAAAGLLVVLGVGRPAAPTPSESLAARAEALRREQLDLKRELEALRSLAQETAPVLYLGSEAGYDLVLDLRPGAENAAARPAVFADPALPEPRRATHGGDYR